MPQGYKSISTLGKGQQGLLQQLLSSLQGQSGNIQQSPLFQQGGNFLQQLLSGSPEAFKSFEAPAMRQFNEQIIPGIAERFSGLGAGSQSSSAFQQALGQAGAGLSEQLQALRSGLQFGAIPQALGYAQQPISNFQGMAGLGLGTQSKGFMPKQQPFWQQLLIALGGGAAQAGGAIGTSYGLSRLGGF
jgi:hypothetical protein